MTRVRGEPSAFQRRLGAASPVLEKPLATVANGNHFAPTCQRLAH
jgi:hypothetical protein